MRRSICYCEPNSALAGEINNWKFIYTTSSSLPKGAKVKFDLESKGRDIDWQVPTVNLKKNRNVIYLEMQDGKTIAGKEIETPESFTPQFEFILPKEVLQGESLTIHVGTPKGLEASAHTDGTKAQTNSQRRRSFSISVAPTSKSKYDEPEIFTMDIRGNALKNISILTPSYVVRNKRFDVTVRFEDEYGNLTSEAPPETLIEISHEHLRENLNWKIFVPETGFITLPNLYFNEPGVYTIKLRNTYTKEFFCSSPIKCFGESDKSLFWGLLHGESERIDSTENIENCLRYFRDDKAMNFFASSPFENAEETSTETWRWICQHIAEFDESERFTAIVGFQWQGEKKKEGLRHFIYAKEHKTLLRKKDPKYSSLNKLYKNFAPKELIAIPCFTMGENNSYDFKHFDPDFERVVEIYNAWGSSECSSKEENPRPITSFEGKNNTEFPEGSIQEALKRNCRFGFVAGGLDDRGVYADLFEGDQQQYSPGLTAILATEYSRSAIFDALYNRSCYATTGKRIIVGFYLASFPMGSETSTAQRHGFLINRHLHGFVAGTTEIATIEIIRNGSVIYTCTPKAYSADFFYDDMDLLESITIDAKDKKPPFVYYYVRVTQIDGHIAWSSPIWVDYVPESVKGKSTVKLRSSKASKPSLNFHDDDESDDEEIFDTEDESSF